MAIGKAFGGNVFSQRSSTPTSLPTSLVQPPPVPQFPMNMQSTAQRNPDISRAQGDIRNFRDKISPEQRSRDAMAQARELGVGMTAEARANEARRGVSGTGVSSYNDRNIQDQVMNAALQAGEKAKYGGEELVMQNLGLGLNAAQAQNAAQSSDLDRAQAAQMAQYQAQVQAQMAQYQAQMQQQAALQQALLSGITSGSLSVDGGGGGASLSAPRGASFGGGFAR